MSVQGETEAPLLRIAGATVRRGRSARVVLDDLHLEIQQGEHTAILGPNGSGKSSLIKLIALEYRPLARDGEPAVQVFGRDRWDVFELRSSLGIVSPDTQNRLTDRRDGRALLGLDVVLSGFFASEGVPPHRRTTAAMRERAGAALAQMEASHLAATAVHEMSTGEARRVLIARALVAEPRALLLDEPTGGLDLGARHRFLETLRRLARGGTTIVLVTHRVEEVLPEVERVVLLRDGRVAVSGPKGEVLCDAPLSVAYGAALHVEEVAGGYYSAVVRES